MEGISTAFVQEGINSGHLRVDQSLDNGHLALGELLLGVTTSGVGNVDGMLNVDVVNKGDVLDLNAISTDKTLSVIESRRAAVGGMRVSGLLYIRCFIALED